MNIKDLLKNASHMTMEQMTNRLNELVHQSPKFQNLDEKNRELVLNLIKKYKDHLRAGRHITEDMIRRDMYSLYEKRIELNLSECDRKDIREILEAFRS